MMEYDNVITFLCQGDCGIWTDDIFIF